MTYQTIDELKEALADRHDRVINFNNYSYYKDLPFRDRCLANWGTTGDFVINHKAGNFGGTIGMSYK